jgi:hypothetical protein
MPTTIIPKKRILAKDLRDADRKFWKALQASGKTSFTTDDLARTAISLGKSARSAKRYTENLRANGKLGIQYIYNLYY